MSVLRVEFSGYSVASSGAAARTRPLLGPIAFTVEAGEVVALFGPSGCGKTTLLKLIDGLIPGAGIAWPGGKPRTAWVFQEPGLLPWRSVAENIALALPPGGNRAVIAPLLDSLGLGGWSDAFPNRLSLGMARRVAVARALAAAPELLLLDEPLASLDAAAAMGVRDVLRAHRLTTLLVSHDAADVAALADRVIVLGGNPTVIRGVVAVNALTGPALAQRIAAVHEALP